MIQVRVRNYFPGASWISDQPTLVLEIKDRKRAIKKLLARHDLVDKLAKEVPEFDIVLFAGAEGNDKIKAPEQWFSLWLDALLTAAGVPQVMSPKAQSYQGTKNDPFSHYELICQCQISDSARVSALLRWSQNCWQAFIAAQHTNSIVKGLAERLKRLIGRDKVKPSLLALARELDQRRVPFEWDLASGQYHLWIGLGAKSQRISQEFTDRTSSLGLHQAKNKHLTRQLLQRASMPTAKGSPVPDLEAALKVAEQLGYPVVCKPVAGDQGRGVVPMITNSKELKIAWNECSRHKRGVLIETHIPGRDYRFLIVRGKLLAAVERLPCSIVGDGIHSVKELVEKENNRRRMSRVRVEGGILLSCKRINLNAEAESLLASHGLTIASVPAEGREIRLSRIANFSHGGSVRECLSEVNSSTRLMLEKVASLFCLDIVGVDVIARDIREPLHAQGGVICEVNGRPGVLPHMLAEPGRSLMGEILDILLERTCTVPVVVVHGESAAELIATIEEAVAPGLPGLTVAARTGIRQGGIALSGHDATACKIQQQVLRDPAATALLLQFDGRNVSTSGVSHGGPDLLILSRPGADPLPEHWRSWLCQSATRVVYCYDNGSNSVTSLKDAQRLAIMTLSGAS